MAEYEVINDTGEDSFESFCKKNKGEILEKLKGKKMKKRHFKNARKLLDESTDLPTLEKNEILIEAIGETVNESESEGFEGEEFDHFRFARKLRQRVERRTGRPLPRLGIKNISKKKATLQTLGSALRPKHPKRDPGVIIRNGQFNSPANPNTRMHPNLDLTKPIDRPGYTPTGNEVIEDKKNPKPIFESGKAPLVKPSITFQKSAGEASDTPSEDVEESVPPAEEMKAIQEARAETVASNGQLAFPKETSDTQGSSGESETPADSDEKEIQAGAGTASGQGTSGNEPAKTTETKPEEKLVINKKWLVGGGILVLLIILILVVALKK